MSTVAVLSGGGAKGSFQVGVLKSLNAKGVRFDALYGTSVGALNAAGFACNGADGLEKLWRSIKGQGDILSLNLFKLLTFRARGLYTTAPLRKLINAYITPHPQANAVVCKTSLLTGATAYGRSNDADFLDSVEASTAIPGIMEPIGEWVDGGVREQTPLKQAFVDFPNLSVLYVILCNPYIKDLEPDTWKVGGPIENAFRAVDIMEHEVFLNDIATCLDKNTKPGFKKVDVVLYAPAKTFIDTLDFSPAPIAQGIELGQSALPQPLVLL